jgi:hypothetical protein
MQHEESRYLSGRRILPEPIRRGMSAVELIDQAFLAYNGRRLREACRLFAQKMLEPDVTVGITLAGALTPAGMGLSALAPLIEAGFIDWIVSTGANLYHDTHFGLAMELREGTSEISDIALREESVIRIYDIFFHYDVLLSTDAFYRELIAAPEFDRPMSTAECHYLVGTYLAERERLPLRRADLHLVARRQLDRDERGGDGAGGEQVALRCQRRCERDGRDRARREARRRQERRLHPRRRLAQELHPPDRTAHPGSARHRRAGP